MLDSRKIQDKKGKMDIFVRCANGDTCLPCVQLERFACWQILFIKEQIID